MLKNMLTILCVVAALMAFYSYRLQYIIYLCFVTKWTAIRVYIGIVCPCLTFSFRSWYTSLHCDDSKYIIPVLPWHSSRGTHIGVFYDLRMAADIATAREHMTPSYLLYSKANREMNAAFLLSVA